MATDGLSPTPCDVCGQLTCIALSHLEKRVLCPKCEGDGWAIPRSPFDDGVRCARCNGAGLIWSGPNAD